MCTFLSYVRIYSTKNIVGQSVGQVTKDKIVKISKCLFLGGYLRKNYNFLWRFFWTITKYYMNNSSVGLSVRLQKV